MPSRLDLYLRAVVSVVAVLASPALVFAQGGVAAQQEEASRHPAASVRTTIRFLVEGTVAPVPARVVLTPELGLAKTAEAAPARIEREITVPGELALALEPGWTWILGVEAPGLWAPETRERIAGDSRLIIRLYPAGIVFAPFADVRRSRDQPATTLQFSFAEGGANNVEPRSGEVPCLREGTGLVCTVPLGVWDLRFKAQGLVPIYRWAVAVHATERARLSELDFRPGASVSGRVEEAGSRKAVVGGLVGLELGIRPGDLPPGEGQRIKVLASETTTDSRGFFQLDSVAPGRYQLTVSQPGYAPLTVGPIEVHAGLESQLLEVLKLSPPVSTSITLVPATDPYGQPWSVDLRAFSPQQKTVGQARREPASDAGSWRRDNLAPGHYRLEIFDQQGSKWLDRSLQVTSTGLDELVEIPAVDVRGTIRRGTDPVAGTLWFEGEGPFWRVRLEADEEGVFEGFLPAEGEFPVELHEATTDEPRLRLPPVAVHQRAGESHARVEIKIPDTRLEGVVVDERGEPVAEADILAIHAQQRSGKQRFRADRAGRFRIRGLREGVAQIQAVRAGEESDTSTVTLREGVPAGPIRLTLQRKRLVEGRVVSRQGFVTGARVTLLPDLANGIATVVSVVSGLEGRFRLDVPERATAVSLWVEAGGLATQLARYSAPEQGEILVELGFEAGSVHLALGSDVRSLASALLAHRGAVVPVLLLVNLLGSAAADPSAIELNGVEPGDYALCGGVQAVRALRENAPPPTASCASGVLPPHGSLQLAPPGGVSAGN